MECIPNLLGANSLPLELTHLIIILLRISARFIHHILLIHVSLICVQQVGEAGVRGIGHELIANHVVEDLAVQKGVGSSTLTLIEEALSKH